jgi:hypothetical protein
MKLFPRVRYGNTDLGEQQRKYKDTGIVALYDPDFDEIVIAPETSGTRFIAVTLLHELIHFVLAHTINHIRDNVLDDQFDWVAFRIHL